MICRVDLHPSTSSPYLETFWEVHLLLTQPGAFPCTGGRCCHTETHKSDRRPSVPLLQHRRVTWQVIMSHHWLVWSISPGHTPPSRAGGMSGDLSLTSPTASWLESEIVSIMSVRRLKALYIISQTLIAVNLIELNIDGLCLNITFRLPPPPSTSHVSSELLFQNWNKSIIQERRLVSPRWHFGS